MQIDPGSSVPIFRQIVNEIQSLIAAGAFPEGERIPSARELAQELKVNPNTVQKAYTELVEQGLIEARRGIGKFVARKGPGSAVRQSETAVREILGKAVRMGRAAGFSDKRIRELLAQEFSENQRKVSA